MGGAWRGGFTGLRKRSKEKKLKSGFSDSGPNQGEESSTTKNETEDEEDGDEDEPQCLVC